LNEIAIFVKPEKEERSKYGGIKQSMRQENYIAKKVKECKR
jgi:hypothetical protein